MKSCVLLSVLVVICLFGCVQSDALSLSIAGMEKLIMTEKQLIDNLEFYLGALEIKAQIIRSNLNRMRAENEKALLDMDSYLMNPLQAFSLMRRTHSDWVHWEVYMQKPVGEEYVARITNTRPNTPTKEEFHEAADAIYRLQDTYGMNPIQMAVGILNGKQYGARLSAIDSFSMAMYLDEKEKHEDAALWFHSAMNLVDASDLSTVIMDFDLTKVLYFYAQNFAKQDDLERAVLLLTRLLGHNPQNANALRQKQMWELEIKAKANLPKPTPKVKSVSRGHFQYQSGCRGAFEQRKPNLYCIYNTTTDPFLKLAPFKMEVVNLNPYMILYHDVISDYEINVLKEMAKPKLIRATVYNAEMKKAVPVATRTSKFAWFPDNTNAVTQRVNRRLADMTGFELHNSEQLQVMNYGLGGHYDTHYDFFNISSTAHVVQASGDRIATALFYLSDVEQGGATVFPNIELAIYPKKGSLILWYNLDSRGQGDGNTLHAACPVIVGSKWICNKWIREREQLFRRPCLRE